MQCALPVVGLYPQLAKYYASSMPVLPESETHFGGAFQRFFTCAHAVILSVPGVRDNHAFQSKTFGAGLRAVTGSRMKSEAVAPRKFGTGYRL